LSHRERVVCAALGSSGAVQYYGSLEGMADDLGVGNFATDGYARAWRGSGLEPIAKVAPGLVSISLSSSTEWLASVSF
jgi:hypothetical protein